MYIPKHFELDADRAAALLAAAETAEVVAAYPDGPEATLLPIEHVPGDGLGSLVMHVTRTNPLWSKTPLGETLAIASGPDGYVDPSWFPGFPESAGVPTWNYVTVHAYGDLVVHDDAEWCRATVTRACERYGYDLSHVDEHAMELMLRSIVGVELRLTRVLAKAKLSQNKKPDFIEAVMTHLDERGLGDDAALSAAMGEIALPHAEAREELVAGIRAERHRGEARPR